MGRSDVKTVIIALPVPEDTDIFNVQEEVTEAFPPRNDSEDCCVYENVDALLDDLGFYVVETIYNTDPEGGPVAEDDYSNRTLHGPFTSGDAAQRWMDDQPDDMDVREMYAFDLNPPRRN